jgi:ABC-2 type transport system permease protein
MFNWNLFKRTIAEQKIAFPVYLGSLALYALMMIASFPSIAGNQQAIVQYWDSFPETMKKFFGSQELSIGTFEGFISLEYMLAWQMILIAFAIALSTRLTKETEDGTLELILSYPISRLKLILSKFAAAVCLIISLTFLSSVVLYLFTFINTASISFGRLMELSLVSSALFFAFLGIGFLCAALFNERGKAIAVMVAVLVVSYLIDVFAGIWDRIKNFHFLSLFKYAKVETILKNGVIDEKNLLILLGVGIVSFIIAAFLFQRKDIQGR